MLHSQDMTYVLVLFLTAGLAFCADPTSHMLAVNGAKLEYLDWGGSGPPMLFLAGLGDTPYIYNDLAPEFTSSFRCYGLTRRGHGRSEKSSAGYRLDELVGDIAAFLKALNLRGVTVVGHSYGGLEIMRLAELHPDRIQRAVILDIAYAFRDESGRIMQDHETVLGKVIERFIPPGKPLEPIERRRAVLKFMNRSWSDAAEANLREQVEPGQGNSLMLRLPATASKQILAERGEWWRKTRIEVPALFVFAHQTLADVAARLDIDSQLRKEVSDADEQITALRQVEIDAIRRDSPRALFVELPHTPHRCFIFAKDRVVSEMRQFLR